MGKKSARKWQWFSVKLIFENIISGEPEPNTIDKNYGNSYKIYEESLVLIKAQSFDHAYKIAEKKAKESEMDYTNPYGQLINFKFIEAIDCFSINEETLYTGAEIYSRVIRVNKPIVTEDFIDRYYPDTIEDNSGVDYQFVLPNREFNKRPNSQD